MESKETVCAVVVTYNRKELLIECLEALLKQTRPLDGIYIIDNASTDGTAEFLKDKGFIQELPPEELNEPWEKEFILENKLQKEYKLPIYYVRMNENTGGAGGFYEGVKRAYEKGYDWLWLMDDDVEPLKDALEALFLNKKKLEKIGFLNSIVRGIDKNSLNIPNIDFNPTKNGYANWEKYLKDGIVKLESSTFVSCLINKEIVKLVGLPIKEMFIWGDDIEYTKRIRKNGYYGYLIGNSEVIHKRHNQKSINIFYEENKQRIKLYYYSYRNNFYNSYRDGKKEVVKFLIKTFLLMIKILVFKNKYKFYKIVIIGKGIFNGFSFIKIGK